MPNHRPASELRELHELRNFEIASMHSLHSPYLLFSVKSKLSLMVILGFFKTSFSQNPLLKHYSTNVFRSRYKNPTPKTLPSFSLFPPNTSIIFLLVSIFPMASCRGSRQPPPPIIGKAGRYTIIINRQGGPEKARPPVLPPPVQFQKPPPAPSPSSAFCFFWNALSKVQKVYSRVDDCLADLLGLNQSKYQWALIEYYETKELGNDCLEPKDPTVGGKVLGHWTAC